MSEEVQNTQNQTADQPADTNQAGGEQQTAEQQAEARTFSQEDVNNIVAREVKKAQEKLFRELGIEEQLFLGFFDFKKSCSENLGSRISTAQKKAFKSSESGRKRKRQRLRNRLNVSKS